MYLRVVILLFCGVYGVYGMNSQKRDKTILSSVVKPKYVPIGIKQETYVDYLKNDNIKIVLGVGSAGTGKTLFACDAAIKMLREGKSNINKIILTRPLVSVQNENIGFLPGDINEKMNPWLLPIFDVFHEYFSQNEIDKKIRDGEIEICPLGYMRGRTFKNCFIIADEIQNATPSQVLMLVTRVGLGTKMVITGDGKQSDLECENGLNDLIKKVEKRKIDGVGLVIFDNEDVRRSEIVKQMLLLYSDF
jgi:phosphate starvation-inducible PhoH-like protein